VTPADPWDAVVRPRRVRARLPRVGDGITQRINLLDAYAELAAVAMARAQFYGELLDAQFEHAQGGEQTAGYGDDDAATGLGGPEDAAGLIGYTYAASVVGHGEGAMLERVATGEEVRALVELEGKERDRAAKLIETCMKIGVELQQVEVIRSYARTIATALQSMVDELGLDLRQEPVLRAAKRAGLQARRAMGQDDGDPDIHIGPALSPQERVSALRSALEGAEHELARASVEGK
jgi:hypothetical protein